jgi:iron complex transport system permease protein
VVLSGIGARAAGLLACAGVLAVVALMSLALGTAEVDIGSVVAAFTSFDGSNAHLIVTELRLPRTLIGLAVGVALGLSGTLMQGLTRNPLAEPGILGVSAGASLMVVIAIAWFGITEVGGYLWFALAGAAAGSAVVYALGSVGRAGATPVRLVLAGAVLTALLGSITSAILVLDQAALQQFRFWEVGTIASRDFGALLAVAPVLLVGAVVGLASGRQLNALSLGDDVARSLGQPVKLVRALVAGSTILLAGAAVALAGPIAFIGLAVPHAARMLVGADYRWLIAYAVVIGPILLLVADIAGRIVGRPGEVQVGIMTALIGVPIFVWLARRSRLAAV